MHKEETSNKVILRPKTNPGAKKKSFIKPQNVKYFPFEFNWCDKEKGRTEEESYFVMV